MAIFLLREDDDHAVYQWHCVTQVPMCRRRRPMCRALSQGWWNVRFGFPFKENFKYCPNLFFLYVTFEFILLRHRLTSVKHHKLIGELMR